MNLKFFVIFFAATLAYQSQVSSASDYYIGAVVEFNPGLLYSDNLKHYESLIEEASKQKADIIVFPEGGLMALSAVVVPDPLHEISPCDNNNTYSDIVTSLSCAAKKNSIYVVANIREERKIIDSKGKEKIAKYNTNVVFDRQGVVIARYVKYNLFDENATKPEKAEPIFFTTDFGVTFGTFICFDILFQEPTLRLAQQYGITDFVFSTFWFSELPFLTAYQVQQGWAAANNVNLLASGVNMPDLGSTGSGIFNGKWGPLVVSFEDRPATKLLVAQIKKIKKATQDDLQPIQKPAFSNVVLDFTKPNTSETTENTSDPIKLQLLHDQIFRFNSKQVTVGGPFDYEVCSNYNFCCSFRVKVEKTAEVDFGYNYRVVAFDGVRMFGRLFKGGVQSCGLILCNGPTLLNCTARVPNISDIFRFTQIEIKGNFNSRNSIQFPTTLIGTPQLEALPSKAYLFQTEVSQTTRRHIVSLELLWPVTNLQTFAIWGRKYVTDGREVSKSINITNSTANLIPHSFLILFLCFLSGASYLLK